MVGLTQLVVVWLPVTQIKSLRWMLNPHEATDHAGQGCERGKRQSWPCLAEALRWRIAGIRHEAFGDYQYLVYNQRCYAIANKYTIQFEGKFKLHNFLFYQERSSKSYKEHPQLSLSLDNHNFLDFLTANYFRVQTHELLETLGSSDQLSFQWQPLPCFICQQKYMATLFIHQLFRKMLTRLISALSVEPRVKYQLVTINVLNLHCVHYVYI